MDRFLNIQITLKDQHNCKSALKNIGSREKEGRKYFRIIKSLLKQNDSKSF